jgi:hypothetical protein
MWVRGMGIELTGCRELVRWRPSGSRWEFILIPELGLGGLELGPQMITGKSSFMRHRTSDLGRRLVRAQTLIDDLAQQIVVGPGQIFDFRDQRWPDPMQVAQHQG